MQCTYIQTDLHDLSCQEGYECMMHFISQLWRWLTHVCLRDMPGWHWLRYCGIG
jgi:hypothetical protein